MAITCVWNQVSWIRFLFLLINQRIELRNCTKTISSLKMRKRFICVDEITEVSATRQVRMTLLEGLTFLKYFTKTDDSNYQVRQLFHILYSKRLVTDCMSASKINFFIHKTFHEV